MPALHTLPTELLDHVLTHLSRKSILNLSKTCKALNFVSTSHLYHTIQFLWKASNKPNKQPRIASLLRTIVANPDRANLIKVVDFKASGFTARDERKLSYPKKLPGLSTEEVTAAHKVLHATKLPRYATWIEHLDQRDLDVVVVLFIAQLHKLIKLSLSVYFIHNNQFFPLLMSHAINTPRGAHVTGFTNLEYIALGVDMLEYTHDDALHLHLLAGHFLPVFYFQSLKSACVMLPLIDSAALPWPLATAPSAPSLVTLRLQRTRASPTTVASILDTCPNISMFEYDYRPRIGSARLDCAVLVSALERHKDTLQHLRICLQPYSANTLLPWEFTDTEYQDGIIGTGLKTFPVLQSLEISLAVLLGWTTSTELALPATLPPNLQVLTIRDDCWSFEGWEWNDKDYLKLFYVFLKHGKWRETCAHLQCMNLRLEVSREDDWNVGARETFRKMCSVKGIEGRVCKVNGDEDEDQKDKREAERREMLATVWD